MTEANPARRTALVNIELPSLLLVGPLLMLIVVRHMAAAALACLVATSSWCVPQDVRDRASNNSTTSQNQMSGLFPTAVANKLQCLCPLSFLKNLSSDQKTIWLSPLRLREHDTAWLVPFGIVSAGLIASTLPFTT